MSKQRSGAGSRARAPVYCAALLLICAFCMPTGAAARIFSIPPDNPAATIDVPDDWRASSTRDGVVGAASNVAVRVAAYFLPASDLVAANNAALQKLGQSGVKVDPETRRAAPLRYNGLDALRINYSGTDPNGDSDITIVLVAAPAKPGFVAICYWGEDEAQESVGTDLQSITDSVEPAK